MEAIAPIVPEEETCLRLARLTQPSIVKFGIRNSGDAPTRMLSASPSKMKASPALPGARPVLPSNAPGCFIALSVAFASPGHHEIRPDGTGAHAAARRAGVIRRKKTVRTASFAYPVCIIPLTASVTQHSGEDSNYVGRDIHSHGVKQVRTACALLTDYRVTSRFFDLLRQASSK